MKKRFFASCMALVMCISMMPLEVPAKESASGSADDQVMSVDLTSDVHEEMQFDEDNTIGSEVIGKESDAGQGIASEDPEEPPVSDEPAEEPVKDDSEESPVSDESAEEPMQEEPAEESVLDDQEERIVPKDAEEELKPDEPEEALKPDAPEEALKPDTLEDDTEPNDGKLMDGTDEEPSGTCGDDLNWVLDNEGTLMITGSGEMTSAPWLNHYAEDIKTVILPEGLTYLCVRAFFGCSGLTEVEFPSTLLSIPDSAFYACSGLTSVTIGGQITEIGELAFMNCTGLKNVVIGDSVTTVRKQAFYDCYGIETLTLGKNVSYIEIYAFQNLPNLKTFYYNIINLTIEDVLIANDKNFNNIGCDSGGVDLIFGDEVIYFPNTIFSQNYLQNIKSIIIGNGIESIGDRAFANNIYLTSLTIGENVTSIGAGAFSGCTNLATVTYNAKNAGDLRDNSVVFGSAGTEADGITVVFGDAVEHIPVYLFSHYNSSIARPKVVSVTVGPNVTSIGDAAFYRCATLEKLVIPSSVQEIGSAAFEGCTLLKTAGPIGGGYDFEFGWTEAIPTYPFRNLTDLESVVIPDSVKTIGNYAFQNHASLSDAALPSSLETIGTSAFEGCTSITEAAIGENVTSIGGHAFSGCTNLATVTYNAKNAGDLRDNSVVFGSAGTETAGITVVFGDAVEHIPVYLFSHYNSSIARPKVVSVTVGPNVTSIGDAAFYRCATLEKLVIPSSVQEIGSAVFEGCTLLKTAGPIGGGYDFEFGWTEAIPTYPFRNLTDLESVVIPDSVTRIGNNAFQNHASLSDTALPSSLETIGKCAFAGCTSFTEAVIGENVTSIGERAFEGCTSITEATIGENVASIGAHAFYGCTNLETVTYNAKNAADLRDNSVVFGSAGTETAGITVVFGNAVEHIPVYLFSHYNSSIAQPKVVSVTVGPNVTSIGDAAFYRCATLEKLVIPSSVQEIGSAAFEGCTLLKTAGPIGGGYDFEFGWTEAIPTYPFRNFTALERVVIPDSVKTIGNYAFQNHASLSYAALPSSLETIGTSAFEGCTSITEAAIGENVTSIGGHAFYGCTNLETVTYNAKNAADLRDSSVVFGSAGTEADGITVVFGDAVEHIPVYLFSHYNSSIARPKVVSVTVGPNVTSIGYGAFYNCTYLTNLVIPEGVQEIGAYAFAGCHDLEVVLPYSLTTLGSNAFSADNIRLATGCMSEAKNWAVLNGYAESSAGDQISGKQYRLIHKETMNIAVEPTCTEDGLTEGRSCSECGKVYAAQEKVDKLGHDIIHHDAKAATCTEDGWEAYDTCSRCNYSTFTEIKAGHTEEVIPGKAPTCTETGLTEGKECSICHTILEAQEEIPKLDHTEEVIPGKAPTCTETGLTEGKECSVCHTILEAQEEITAAGHIPGTPNQENTIPATYTQKGSYEEVVYCTVCKKELSRQTKEIAKLPQTNIGKATVTVKNQTYTGKALTPAPTVKLNGITLKNGTDYKLSYKNNKNAGTATVTITGINKYTGSVSKNFTINKAASTIALKAKTANYNGKTININPAAVKGSKGKITYTYYSDSKCTKKVSAHKNARTYYVKATVAADNNYKAATSKAVKLIINKIANPMTVKAKTGLTASAKTNTTITKAKAFTISKAQGTVTFKKTKGDAKITVASTGNITVKKGLKKGTTYPVTVKVTVAGNTNYKAGSKTVTLKIKVN